MRLTLEVHTTEACEPPLDPLIAVVTLDPADATQLLARMQRLGELHALDSDVFCLEAWDRARVAFVPRDPDSDPPGPALDHDELLLNGPRVTVYQDHVAWRSWTHHSDCEYETESVPRPVLEAIAAGDEIFATCLFNNLVASHR